MDTHPLTIYSVAVVQELTQKVEQQFRAKDGRIAELEERILQLERIINSLMPNRNGGAK